MRAWARNFVLFVTVALGFAASLWVVAWLVRPDLSGNLVQRTPEEVEQALAARDVRFDPEHTPSLHRHVKVTPSGESPILAEMVRDGLLPPVQDRLPAEPVVMAGVDGIGKYGGTWLRLANGPEDVGIITYRLSGPYFVRWSPLGYPIEPHFARSVEHSPDKKVWTIHMRPGMRWSDGAPFTADDVMYWWDYEATHPKLTSVVPPFMVIGGKAGRVEKLDQYTVRFSFDEPYALFMEQLASASVLCDTPAHYLKPYHPDPAVGNQELIEQEMRRYRMPSAVALYRYMRNWQNPEHPRMWPWIYRSAKSNPPQVFIRNPYYPVVDEAGNQLPYIDRMQFEVQDGKLLALTAANGGVSMQGRHIRFSDYTELMSRREAAGTRILHWYPGVRSVFAINPNQNRRVDPADPSTAKKAELLSDKRFRQALSLAIDRQQIIRAEYNGIGEPSQVAPGRESPFHSERLARAFVEFDPARANALLDELGLTGRDSEGFRTFRDGSKMTFFFDFTAFTGIGPGQFVVDDWGAVGLRFIIRERARPLFYAEKDSMDFDVNVWSGESDFMPLVQPRYFIANNPESFYAVGWGKWYMRGGLYGFPDADRKGVIPPPEGHPMRIAMQTYEQALREPDEQKQKQLVQQVMDIAAENLWSISIATPPPALIVVDARMRNVPAVALWGNNFSTPSNAGIETYFFTAHNDSPGAIAEVRNAILTPTLRPGGVRAGQETPWVNEVVSYLLWGVGILAVLLLALRHPFIGRRILIMVPTMLVISVIVFTIIQLPPGDFLSTRIMQLQETGDEADLRVIDDLRRMFHFEEPSWKLYLRWMGVYWFATFEPADEGLLQGNLGRSMETQQPINTMVGDRILLTVLMSLGTIVFTWALALPIGIYSAVKQYSIGDYILTLVGFVGMCVPAFLLALVLMAVSGVSGLFSPEYAAQPEWTWGKFLDLMKHMWIPVVVLGVGGTAGMIRVMRANLLDELRKPYVTTAQAKGVRPTRLLLKYPVRLALNPFISGIGALFPQLVSGGAIVSMVLALPTVGPLMLQALFNEDMYLAGSMLMVLSLLGIIGTLVSDLLLLWLDPRIRFEGGSR
jgi:ABC-type dipeptide/oligopeptide/nickel transport system permease component/ABC-type transport system substrate-binding protein